MIILKEIIKKVQQVRSHEVEILQLADLLVELPLM